ncbi:MAG TPA: efflux RND transporter periplasmic adaptor subunit [Bryobacteraceae bacterium]|nr:efflux RND transporter periplasmic adaptor subunit [Bryobacteraceae bacterium]
MKYIKAVKKTGIIWLVASAAIILAAIGAGALTVLWREHAKPAQKAAVAPVAPAIGSDVSLEGKIQALRVVEVPAPVEGTVDVFHVDIGQEIFEGQLLAQINSNSLTGAEEHATQLADRARDRLNDLEASIIAGRLEASRARAVASRLKSEYDRSEKFYQRQRMLLGAGATPRLVFEKAEKEYLTNQAESASAEALAQQVESRVDSLLKEQDAAKKTLEERTHELEAAKADLAASEVHSPVDGVVVGRRGNAGDDVDRSMKDLFRIATDLSQLAVVVEPPAPVLARIHPGQTAVVTVSEAQNEPLAAEVKKVENGQVTVEFVSPDPAVKPGLTAQVRIKLT